MTNRAVSVELPVLDLSNVLEQLSRKPELSNWTPERFDSAVGEYKKFLALVRIYKDTPIVPSRDADVIWHQHILNTRDYTRDSQETLGYYLHHRPCLVTHKQWQEILNLYQKTFGEPLSSSADCSSGDCSGDGCTP